MENMQVFSPVVEIKIQARYQVTSAVNVSAGWSGLFISNVARPSDMINWALDETSVFGVLRDRNNQNVFMNGLTAGVEINR
jgi:hypothetical protein